MHICFWQIERVSTHLQKPTKKQKLHLRVNVYLCWLFTQTYYTVVQLIHASD